MAEAVHSAESDRTLRDETPAPGQSLEEALEALRRSEQRFRSLVQNSSDVITVLDEHGIIRWQSPSIERVLGHPPDQVLGMPLSALVHPDDVAHVRAAIEKWSSDAAPQPLQLRLRHRDGSWRHLEAIGSSLLDDPSVGGIVLNSRDVTERQAFEDQLARQAFFDPLTGLPNRILLMYSIQHALANAGRRRIGVGVLFLDLDGFKLVNDSFGHQAGDQLLHALGQRLKQCLRPGDTVARLGGDEFAILLEDITQPAVAERVARRILDRLHAPFNLEGRELYVTASIGIAFGTPADATPDDLLRFADAAMYRAKAEGKARCLTFDRTMHAALVARLGLEGDLRRAIEEAELSLEYQPIVELRTDRVVGVEAFVRWQHPERGRLAPADFIPLADETGLIVPLGRHVLDEACRRARAWQLARPDQPALSVSVNLSPRQFQQSDLVDQVSRVLADTGLDPSSLEIDVPESVLLDQDPLTPGKAEALHRLGVRLALDDFGTGYSSLNSLRRLPLQTVKLDRVLIGRLDDPGTTALVAAAIALGHTLGMGVVAEGVETAEELAHLRELGCDRAQGYCFSPPVPADAVAALLESGRAIGSQDVETNSMSS